MGHSLSLLGTSPYPSGGFLCNICREEGCGPVYHCSNCDFDVHVTCAATAAQQTHFSHSHHPLHLSYCGNRSRTCDSCGSYIHTWSFQCELCNYDMHPMCVRAPRFMLHPRHTHPLELSKAAEGASPRRCDGCELPVTKLFYRCNQCHYNLHQGCATLPSKIKHVKHQGHFLTLMDPPFQEVRPPQCCECEEKVTGWRFHCAMCNFNLHPTCANLVHELPQSNAAIGGSNATTSNNTSLNQEATSRSTVSSCSDKLIHTPLPTTTDWEAVERVLQYARGMAKVTSQVNSVVHQNGENQDTCPTCLEGFDFANPKKLTKCGHYFHLVCILEWMERSTKCPICRKHLKLLT